MHRTTRAVVVLFLLMGPLVGCGYLDDDLLTSDEEFQQSLTAGGMSLSGRGYGHHHGYGCGGAVIRMSDLGLIGRIRMRPRSASTARSPSEMTDEEILNQTDIGVLDVTEAESPVPTDDVAAVYYETKSRRDRDIAAYYGSSDPVDAVEPGGEE